MITKELLKGLENYSYEKLLELYRMIDEILLKEQREKYKGEVK